MELLFNVTNDEGWWVAVCDEPPLATQAESIDELPAMVRELIQCHFDADEAWRGAKVRLHFAEDPVLSVG